MKHHYHISIGRNKLKIIRFILFLGVFSWGGCKRGGSQSGKYGLSNVSTLTLEGREVWSKSDFGAVLEFRKLSNENLIQSDSVEKLTVVCRGLGSLGSNNYISVGGSEEGFSSIAYIKSYDNSESKVLLFVLDRARMIAKGDNFEILITLPCELQFREKATGKFELINVIQ